MESFAPADLMDQIAANADLILFSLSTSPYCCWSTQTAPMKQGDELAEDN